MKYFTTSNSLPKYRRYQGSHQIRIDTVRMLPITPATLSDTNISVNWAYWIRTNEYGNQNPVPYRLGNAQCLLGFYRCQAIFSPLERTLFFTERRFY